MASFLFCLSLVFLAYGVSRYDKGCSVTLDQAISREAADGEHTGNALMMLDPLLSAVIETPLTTETGEEDELVSPPSVTLIATGQMPTIFIYPLYTIGFTSHNLMLAYNIPPAIPPPIA